MYYRIGKGGKKYWGKRGAGILFTDGDKVLLLRRAGSGGAADHVGKWCLPGGKSEDGENPLDTARRECREEIGTVKGVRFGQFDERDGHHVFTVFLFKVDEPFEVKLSSEHDAARWLGFSELSQLPLHPEFKENLPDYIKAIEHKFTTNFSKSLTSRPHEGYSHLVG